MLCYYQFACSLYTQPNTIEKVHKLANNPYLQKYINHNLPFRIMQPPTSRKLISSLSSQTDVLVSQRFSQTLLLHLLRYISILYLIMTVFSIPIWVLSGIEMHKELKQHNRIEIGDILMFGTIAYLDYPRQQSTCRQLTYQVVDPAQINTKPRHDNCEKNTDRQYLNICLYYDIFLQVLLCLGYSLIQYQSFKTKQKNKGNHIQDYCLQISNIAVTHPYIMLPKLQQHLISQLNTHFELIGSQLQLFDAISAVGQQHYMHKLLSAQLETKMNQLIEYGNIQNGAENSCKKRIKQIEFMLKKVDITNVQNDIVWVTFQTRQARYLALRFLQSTDSKFMNRKLKVRKAPHPLQIQWQNMHMSSIKIFLSHKISLIVCMCVLLLFDLLILFIHKSSYPLLASLVILILQIILKEIIIWVSSFEKHRHKSSLNLSIFSKLTKYLYINTALIMFISCFDFADNILVSTFSTSAYQEMDVSWFQGVGMNIFLTFFIQIGYVNVRPAIQVAKGMLKTWIKAKWNHFKQRQGQNQEKQVEIQNSQKERLKSQLDICYAHIISLFMFANTYSFTHPIFYPFSSVLAFLAYRTHRQYIAKYTQPAPYNSDYLNSASIQYLYASVIAHWAILAIGFSFVPAIICSGIATIILLFKNTIFVFLSRICRRKFGPFCFSKFQRSHASTTPLSQLLTYQQLNTHIANYDSKIKMHTYLYNTNFQNEDFVNKSCLERDIKKLQEKIDHLRDVQIEKRLRMCQNKEDLDEQVSNINKSSKNELKGVISYKLTGDMIKG